MEADMVYKVYELHPIYEGGYVYRNDEVWPKVIATLDTGNVSFFDFMEHQYYQGLCYDKSFMGEMKMDETYYLIPEEGYHCYVFSPHLGYAFWDSAEHDERVVIAVELQLDKDKMYI